MDCRFDEMTEKLRVAAAQLIDGELTHCAYNLGRVREMIAQAQIATINNTCNCKEALDHLIGATNREGQQKNSPQNSISDVYDQNPLTP